MFTGGTLPFQDIWTIICEVTATNKLWDFNCFCNGWKGNKKRWMSVSWHGNGRKKKGRNILLIYSYTGRYPQCGSKSGACQWHRTELNSRPART